MSGAGRGRRALVTGGAGFIGSHLVDRLIDAGWSVRVFDDFSTGSERNLAEHRERIDLVRGDVGDPDALRKAVDGIEVAWHLAAVASVPRSVAEPVRSHEVNALGTLRVLEAAREAGVRRVVFAASSAVYGQGRAAALTEDQPAEPRSPYALHKLCGELYCRLYAELHGLETVALRFFNVFGPRQDPDGDYAAVIPRFAYAALAREAATIHGDGGQTRDFVYVDDATHAALLAADAPAAAGLTVNVAAGVGTSVSELWDTLQRLVGMDLPARHGAPRAADVRDSVADLTRARESLGFEPTVSLEDGLRRTLESFAVELERSKATSS